MPATNIRGSQILNDTVSRADLNIDTVGSAVVRKIIQGSNVTLSSTGADSGTGDVTISAGPALNSWTLTSASFTVPAVGSSVTVNVNDTSFATVGEYVWVQSSPTVSDALQITAKTSTTLTLLNPPTAGTKASGDANNLLQIGSDSLLYLPPSAIQPTIWSSRLRSFNSILNPNFEVDQRNVGNQVTTSGTNVRIDKWIFSTSAATASFQVGQAAPPSIAVVPGTNFQITSKVFSVTLKTVQATLAASEYFYIWHNVEGPLLRELINDVHSISILAWCSQPLTFTMFLQTPGTPFYTLCKLCQITTANQWTLFTLPSLPIWTPSATWPITPGALGYTLNIGLGAGSTNTAPANDSWQSGFFAAGPGTTNFAGLPLNTQFALAFIQHEPGPLCTTLQDKVWTQNYDECLRYYCKTYDYGTAVGTVIGVAQVVVMQPNSAITSVLGSFPYKKVMAKTPTIVSYSTNSSTAGTVRDVTAGADKTVSSYAAVGQNAFDGVVLTAAPVANARIDFHYTADTGW